MREDQCSHRDSAADKGELYEEKELRGTGVKG